jgi:general secretion pathway protein G
MDNGSYPTTKQGLRAAVVPSENAPGWSHYSKGYFERKLLDPWGRVFEYRSPGVNNLTGFDLWSFGADGALGGNGFDADIFNGGSSQSD